MILFFSYGLSLEAHAYAGPGAAIGAIIVFFTVIFAFIASVFLSLKDFFSKKSRNQKKTMKKIKKEKK